MVAVLVMVVVVVVVVLQYTHPYYTTIFCIFTLFVVL